MVLIIDEQKRFNRGRPEERSRPASAACNVGNRRAARPKHDRALWPVSFALWPVGRWAGLRSRRPVRRHGPHSAFRATSVNGRFWMPEDALRRPSRPPGSQPKSLSALTTKIIARRKKKVCGSIGLFRLYGLARRGQSRGRPEKRFSVPWSVIRPASPVLEDPPGFLAQRIPRTRRPPFHRPTRRTPRLLRPLKTAVVSPTVSGTLRIGWKTT